MKSDTITPTKETSFVSHYRPKLIRLLTACIGAFIYLSIVSVIMLKWINPPFTSFMVQRQLEAMWNGEEDFEIKNKWVGWDQISPYAKIAVITSEDQSFADHWGFDFGSIQQALEEHRKGDELRGASTITQQVAKNLFLWPGQSFIRKGIEAYFTLLIEWIWTKKRILEVYLNVAEFGNGVYGVGAASEIYFNTTPGQLDMTQSALMATALPSPRRYNLARPSPYMLERRNWVLQYMFYLGNRDYLERIK